MRSRGMIILVAVLSVGLGSEFLGIVSDARPEDVARDYAVVGQTGNGVLVTGVVQTQNVRVLDYIAPGKQYLRVHLMTGTSAAELAALAQILDYDGSEYIVVTDEAGATRVRELRAMVAPLSLRPWVLTERAPQLPAVLPNPIVQQIVSLVSADTVLSYVRRLQQYRTRYASTDSGKAAAQWIAARLRAYGCDTVLFEYYNSSHAPSVIGVRYGLAGQRNPYAIISGHFDSYSTGLAPGADDNASGTAATLEACRVMKNFRFNRDLRFIGWSGEELGLYGSEYYASRARSRGDSILAVLNFDMIGYVDASPEDLNLMAKTANPPCGPLADWFIAVADTYTALPCYKQMVSDNQNSDHGPFWNNGYLALTGIEDFWPTNPHYHTSHDSIGAGYNNNEFCTDVTRAAVAALATLGQPVQVNQPWLSYLRSWVSDQGGNNNGRWDPGESVAVYVRLRNAGMATAHGVSATLSTGDPYVTLFRASSSFGDIAGQDSATCTQPYLARAAAGTPKEHVVSFDLAITSAESTWQDRFGLTVGEILAIDPVPDGPRLPPLYWAYDDIDTGYSQHPAYEWVEIKGVGTRLNFPHNDSVKILDLPSSFGPFKFYGQRYTQVSVSADGWLAPGSYSQRHYANTGLPNPATPPGMICVNWDDLYPGESSSGYVYYYHDPANHRFVVEYDSVAYYDPRSVRDKFQVIIYDTTLAPASGNNVIVCQYMTANRYTSSTIGIEDPTRTIAIQDLYNGTLARGAAPIVAGRAIRYVAEDPTGVTEVRIPPAVRRTRYHGPTILRSVLMIGDGRQDRGYRAELLSVTGQRMIELRPGANDIRGLVPGIYFLRLEADTWTETVKTIITR
ncbi:MAG: M20/M25/M40 family metallo-hydrolase [candidate division WOR-3 bacterium]